MGFFAYKDNCSIRTYDINKKEWMNNALGENKKISDFCFSKNNELIVYTIKNESNIKIILKYKTPDYFKKAQQKYKEKIEEGKKKIKKKGGSF